MKAEDRDPAAIDAALAQIGFRIVEAGRIPVSIEFKKTSRPVGWGAAPTTQKVTMDEGQLEERIKSRDTTYPYADMLEKFRAAKSPSRQPA